MKKGWKKRVEGVISVMLAFLMLPFLSVAGIVVESGRYHSASTLLSEVIDSASYSTLAKYDSYLLDRFGLLGTDQLQPVPDVFSGYLYDNLNLANENGFSGLTVDAKGIYPLTDPDILYYQICEMDKLLSPTTFALEGLNIQDLIKQLEKDMHLINIFKGFSAAGKLVGSAADMTADLEDLKDICEALTTLKTQTQPNTYNGLTAAIQNFKTAAGNYKTAKGNADTAKSAAETAQENLDKAKSELGNVEGVIETVDDLVDLAAENQAVSDAQTALDEANSEQTKAEEALQKAQKEANDARDAYAEALRDYASKLEQYKQKIQDYKDHNAATKTATTDMVSSAVGIGQDFDQAALNKLDKNSSAYADLSFEHNMETQMRTTTASSINELVNNLNESVKAHIDDDMGPYINKMRETADKVAALTFTVDDYGDVSVSEDGNYQVSCPDTIPASEIERVLEEESNKITGSGVLDYIKAAVAVFNTVFQFKGLIDWNLNAVVDKSYFSTYGSGLSSLNLQQSSANQADQARAEHINYVIDNEYNPSGLTASASVAPSKFELLGRDIAAFIENATKITGSGILLSVRLLSFANAITAACRVFDDLLGIFSEGAERLLKMSYDRLMFDQYLIGMLPNRLNYKSGTAMNGYSYSNIALKPAAHLMNGNALNGFLGLLSMIGQAATGKNTMFCGSELEYLICGSGNEYANQAFATLILYVERLIINIPSILTNKTLQSLWQAVPIPGIIIVAVVIFAEPLLDTVLLLNGGKVSLYKDNVYLSPMGIAAYINSLSGLANSSYLDEVADLKSEMSSKVEDLTGVFLDTKDANINHTFGTNKYLSGLLELDYPQHLLIYMFLFGNDKDFSRRLADLVQMEAESKSIKSNPGTHFDLGKSYTFIRAEVTGAVNQIMPIPGLANNSRLSTRILQYRGY